LWTEFALYTGMDEFISVLERRILETEFSQTPLTADDWIKWKKHQADGGESNIFQSLQREMLAIVN
jgi:hypothetical protein